MADPLQVRQHGDPALGEDPLDQAPAAARHDHVDRVVHAQQQADRGPVGGRHALDRGLGQSGSREALLQAIQDRARGMEAFGAAAQDRRVAGLEAEPAGVRRHVGPALVDDADHAERHRDPGDPEPVGPVPFGQHAPHRVGERGDRLEARGHGLAAAGVELEAVEQGGAQPLGPGRLHVAPVGFEDLVAALADRLGRGSQRPDLGFRCGQRELVRGGSRRAAQLRHPGGQIVPQDRGLSGHGILPHIRTKSSRWISSSRPR